jgi:hypothetical protein
MVSRPERAFSADLIGPVSISSENRVLHEQLRRHVEQALGSCLCLDHSNQGNGTRQKARPDPEASGRYVQFVAEGRDVKLWEEALSGQIYLGDEAFVQRMQAYASSPDAVDIPRARASCRPVFAVVPRASPSRLCNSLGFQQWWIYAIGDCAGDRLIGVTC